MSVTRLTLVLAFLLSWPTAVATAQAGAVAIPRERVHPELTDNTWGRRTGAAWQLAFAGRWADARAAFEALHRDQAQAIEPLIGLGFVARAEGHRSDAREWYRRAVVIDPTSADARNGLRAAEWDRPSRFDAGIGTARIGGTTTSDWTVGISTPLTPRLSVNASGGQITGGDPLNGIFFNSANGGGTRASYVTAGALVRPTAGTTLGARATRWTGAGPARDYLWLEGSTRLGPRAGVHAGVRPMSGLGAPQVYGGVDARTIGTQVATVELVQGTRAAPFEARSAVRLFYEATPSIRGNFRLALVREIDPRLSATTAGANGTWNVRPRFGFTGGASSRRGAFARTSASVGIVLRQ